MSIFNYSMVKMKIVVFKSHIVILVMTGQGDLRERGVDVDLVAEKSHSSEMFFMFQI